MMACSFMPIGCFAPPKAALLFAVPALTNVLTRTARLATLAAMAFEWNEDNRKDHLLKHGVDFPDVTPMFDGPTLETVDDRYPYGETRFNAPGETGGQSFVATYAGRGTVRRIISARKANASERKKYYARDQR